MERSDRQLPIAIPPKPCPICGAPAIYATREGYMTKGPSAFCTCSNILCQMGKLIFTITAWNYRPGEALLLQRIEDIRAREALRVSGFFTEAEFAEELAAILGSDAPAPRYTVLIAAARAAELALRAFHAGYRLPDSALDLADHLRVGLRDAGVPTATPPAIPAQDA